MTMTAYKPFLSKRVRMAYVLLNGKLRERTKVQALVAALRRAGLTKTDNRWGGLHPSMYVVAQAALTECAELNLTPAAIEELAATVLHLYGKEVAQ